MHRRLIRLGLTAIAAALAAAAIAAPASAAETYNAHFMGTRGAIHGAGTASLLQYQGGKVETKPVVYIDYWGSWWNSTVTTGSDGGYSYTNQQAKTYTDNFFSNVGGSGWDNTNTQYCQGIQVGLTSCATATAANTISEPTGQLQPPIVDSTNPVPNRITQSAIANEALWLMNQTGGYNPNATYFVYTPSGHSMRGFGTQWCAWHSVTTSGGNYVAYAYMPYQPDAGSSCGENFVNNTSATQTAYGNGYFDGFSIVGGHEYSEAQTDPHPTSGQYGWEDSSGSEIGDKCAWASNSADITLGSNYYAVQPLFSNASDSCVLTYP